MKTTTLLLASILGLVAVGCDDKPAADKATPSSSAKASTKDSAPAKGSATASAAPPASATASAAAADSAKPATSAAVAAAVEPSPTLPTEEDFEDKAETTISATNAADELTKLDKEIGK